MVTISNELYYQNTSNLSNQAKYSILYQLARQKSFHTRNINMQNRKEK